MKTTINCESWNLWRVDVWSDKNELVETRWFYSRERADEFSFSLFTFDE